MLAVVLAAMVACGVLAGIGRTSPVGTAPSARVGTAPLAPVGASPSATDAAAHDATGSLAALTANVGATGVLAADATRRDAALVTQVRSPWLVDGPIESSDCGPAATASALRLLGLDVPGAAGRHDEALVAQARALATGSTAGTARVDPAATTYLPQLERLARAAGARTRVMPSLAQALAWSRAGIPVVVQGRPLRAWDSRLPTSVVRHVAGGHYVTLAGPVSGTSDRWWVLEPLGVAGPIVVTTAELTRYVADWNGAAMAVERADDAPLARAVALAQHA